LYGAKNEHRAYYWNKRDKIIKSIVKQFFSITREKKAANEQAAAANNNKELAKWSNN
jgi:hypothetical protein